jgi:hypothetical protein
MRSPGVERANSHGETGENRSNQLGYNAVMSPSSQVRQVVIEDVIEGKRFPRTAEVACYLCGQPQPPRRIPVALGMSAMVAECPACRLAFQTPQPSPEASMAYMNWRWRSTDPYVGNRRRQLRRARKQITHIKRFVRGPVRLMDFGAGAGAFVRASLDQGWQAVGVESSSSARERAREFFGVDLLDAMDGERYDVITMWDVVEHLRDPRSVLEMLGGTSRKMDCCSWRRGTSKTGGGSSRETAGASTSSTISSISPRLVCNR